MIFNLVLLLLGILILLVLFVNLHYQRKEQLEQEKQNQIYQQKALIEETEEVLAFAPALYCSTQLIILLYQRINDALCLCMKLTKNDIKTHYREHQCTIANELEQLHNQSSSFPILDEFKISVEQNQLIRLVQAAKKLKAILLSENNKGKLDDDFFQQEIYRVDNVVQKISIESSFKQIKHAIDTQSLASAKTMTNEILHNLHLLENQMPSDTFIINKIDKAQLLLKELSETMGVNDITAAEGESVDENKVDNFFKQKKW